MTDKLPTMLATSEDDPAVARAIFDTIENQIRDDDPPAADAALQRLTAAGMARDTALHFIACALSVEFFEILENDGAFDATRYAGNLDALPALPYDESEI